MLESAEDFIFVKSKKKSNRRANQQPSLLHNLLAKQLTICDEETSKRRILEAKEEILTSHFYESILASLRESLNNLGEPVVRNIVCFGIGRISDCTISRYQFALLLCIKDLYEAEVSIYDPVFSITDKSVLRRFGCTVLDKNVEGKFKIENSHTTVFYLPHCPKQLTNNILWSNWGLNLSSCIFVANSFNKIVESNTRRILNEEASYILKILPHILEIAIINNFKFFEIFNDTAVHIFPMEKLKLLTHEFWESPSEPKYLKDNVEFITSSQTSDVVE